ncbi:MAG: hypothetical protein AAF311_05180 [Pseudomonadota bacterium]
MRQYLTSLLAASVLAGGSVLSGCASTASGVQTSSLSNTPPATLTQVAPAGTVLAVVRYPAFVEADDQNAFAESYTRAAIGGRAAGFSTAGAEMLANSVVLKSNYFAMSLYRELTERLPEHSVLLSPHRVFRNADGNLTSEPVTQAESIASVVTIDFTAYTFPDFERMMSDKPSTFGDLVTPLVTVRTDPRASVASEGILLASGPVVDAAAGGNHAAALDDARALQGGRIEASAPELDFISYISGTPRRSPDTTRLYGPADGAVRLYPVETIRLDRYELATLDDTQMDVLEGPFTEAFANRVIRLINGTDATKATMMRRADVIADYDESLAALTLVGSDDPDYLARLRYAERLLEAEQKYLSVQSLRLYDGVMNGEMGAQVRDMLQEEHRVMERRRRLARQQNVSTMAAIAAAVGAVAIASNSNNDGRGASTGEILATQAMLQGAMFSVTEAMRRNRLSKEAGYNYISSVMPTLDAQTDIQVDLIDSNETITAIRFEDLKEKLSELYAENQRALDVTATRCAYDGPDGQGTWLGACANGMAEGTGVGVFRNDQGDLVEHYGHARQGRAEGPGYRIVRTPDESISIEGTFANGLPDGVARVERSGSVVNRQFKDGRDLGAVIALLPVASPFDLDRNEMDPPTG